MSMNPSIPAARVYAKALMDIGEESGELGRIYDDLMGLVKLYREDREFRAFFTSPRVDPDEKYRILKLALGDMVCRPVLGLIHVVIRKGRELLLDNIADQFERFRDLAEGNVHVHIRSARAVDDEIRERLKTLAKEDYGKNAVLHETVEPELIGGMIVRVGDYVVDGSIRRKIEKLRRNMVAKERMF